MAQGTNNMPNYTSYGSTAVNGQLVPNFTMRGMFPSQAAAPYYYGTGSKPPTLAGFAPNISGLNVGTGITGTGIGGGPSQAAAAAPFSFTDSPLPWAIGFLIIGFVGLRHIHWRAE